MDFPWPPLTHSPTASCIVSPTWQVKFLATNLGLALGGRLCGMTPSHLNRLTILARDAMILHRLTSKQMWWPTVAGFQHLSGSALVLCKLDEKWSTEGAFTWTYKWQLSFEYGMARESGECRQHLNFCLKTSTWWWWSTPVEVLTKVACSASRSASQKAAESYCHAILTVSSTHSFTQLWLTSFTKLERPINYGIWCTLHT